jgi:DNA-binding CsgD family transcriptional regulator
VEGVESKNIDVNDGVLFLLEKLGRERARIATQAIAMVGLPACVIDRVGRVLAANNLFEKLAPRVATRSDDRLCLADNSANDSLRRSMEQLNFRAAIAAVSIPVPATGALPPLILHLVPIQGSARAIFTGALALIVATPLSAPSAPPVTLLAALFDLTPTEGRIAGGILEGKAVSRLATELGLSTETVRSYLKSVFRKTGVHRQAELVSLLAGAHPLRR